MNFTTRNSLLIVVFWIAATAFLSYVAPRWSDVAKDGNLDYFPAKFSSSRADKLLKEGFNKFYARGQIVLIVAREDSELEECDYAFADEVAKYWTEHSAELKLSKESGGIWTHKMDIIGDSLKTPEKDAIMVIAQVEKDFLDPQLQKIANIAKSDIDRAKEHIKTLDSYKPGMITALTGSVILSDDLLTATFESLKRTEWITVALVLGFVLLIYRAPLLAIVPLLSIGFAWWSGLLFVTMTTTWNGIWDTIGWHPLIYSTARIFITVLVFGSGTDYCLFLIARYREELHHTPEPRAAMRQAMTNVKSAIIGSAMTSIVGMALMGFADFGKFQSSGYTVSVCLIVTLLASLTLAPALLSLLGKAAFWPMSVTAMELDSEDYESCSEAHHGMGTKFWHVLSCSLVKYPLRWWLIGIGLLAVPVYWGTQIENRYDLIGDLSGDRPSMRGNEVLGKYFSTGMTGPIFMVASRSDGSFTDASGKEFISKLTEEFKKIEHVTIVRSFTQPFGRRASIFDLKRLVGEKLKAVKEMYLYDSDGSGKEAKHLARWEIVLDTTPFTPEAVTALENIEQKMADLKKENPDAWKNIEFFSGGSTAVTRDLEQIITSDQQRIERIVTIGVLFVMLILIRRSMVCFYLMGTVLLSYWATLGITEHLFKFVYHDQNFGIDWKVPLFLFVVLAAVGVDYNIYLVMRVLEEQKKRSPADALRIGLTRTGGIITSCGLIMAASFVAMIWGTLLSIVELGVAFTLGIMLDTLIIRTIIVPSGWRLGDLLIEKYRGRETSQTNTSQN